MKKIELYGLILYLIFLYFLVLGFLTWELRLGFVALTIFIFIYTKYMVRFIQKFHKENK